MRERERGGGEREKERESGEKLKIESSHHYTLL
jgi:hypothetical protein